MAGVYDFIRSPLPVSGRTINIVPCPMLTTAACNRTCNAHALDTSG